MAKNLTNKGGEAGKPSTSRGARGVVRSSETPSEAALIASQAAAELINAAGLARADAVPVREPVARREEPIVPVQRVTTTRQVEEQEEERRDIRKNQCPITRAQFEDHAKPLQIVIDGKHIEADVKEFNSGSFGWFANAKIMIVVDGVRVPAQVGLNVTVVKSGELPR